MKPLFTIHAGEYLVGSEIERKFKNLRVWVPSEDTGIDLLVTDNACEKSVSFQVKYSKDHLEGLEEHEARKNVKAGGWWHLNKSKIENSPADYWVLVISKSGGGAPDFIVLKPKTLLDMHENLFGGKGNLRSQARIMNDGKCWEARGLDTADKKQISQGTYRSPKRDLTKYHNNWSCLDKLNGK
jgi:hypothetical protein